MSLHGSDLTKIIDGFAENEAKSLFFVCENKGKVT